MAKQRYDYFDAFERIARLALDEANLMMAIVEGYEGSDAVEARLPEAHAIEVESDEIVREVLAVVDADFVPALEREDIVELVIALDEVVDEIEKVVKHLYMYDVSAIEPAAVEMCALIQEECNVAVEACTAFRGFKKPEKLTKRAREIDDLEDEVDRLYQSAVRALFTGGLPPEHIIKWRAVYSTIEGCSDNVERAADLMARVVVGNG